jgi:hypothetical protein
MAQIPARNETPVSRTEATVSFAALGDADTPGNRELFKAVVGNLAPFRSERHLVCDQTIAFKHETDTTITPLIGGAATVIVKLPWLLKQSAFVKVAAAAVTVLADLVMPHLTQVSVTATIVAMDNPGRTRATQGRRRWTVRIDRPGTESLTVTILWTSLAPERDVACTVSLAD